MTESSPNGHFEQQVEAYLDELGYVSPHTFDVKAWQIDAADHVDPTQERTAAEQLGFMSDLLGEFGFEMPSPSAVQHKLIAKTVEAYPNHRLFPTPVGRIALRPQLVRPTDTSVLHKIMKDHVSLWMPYHTNRPGKALSMPSLLWLPHVDDIWMSDEIYTEKSKQQEVPPQVRPYGLRYKAPNGQLLTLPHYLKSLRANNDTLQAKDGTEWTFPLLSLAGIEPDTKPVRRDPFELFKGLNYIATPESRLALQIVHMLTGRPVHPDVAHPSNEVIAELSDDHHEVRHIRGVTVITRSADDAFFRHTTMRSPHPDLQSSEAVSALQLIS